MEPGEIEPRIGALEGQVRDLSRQVKANEQDAAAARILAGAADRDVAEIRAEMRGLRGGLHEIRNEFRSELGAFRRATTASFKRHAAGLRRPA